MIFTELYLRLFFIAAPVLVAIFAARRVLYSQSSHWVPYMINVVWAAYVVKSVAVDLLSAPILPVESLAIASTPVVFWILTRAGCNHRNSRARYYASGGTAPERGLQAQGKNPALAHKHP